MNQGFTLIELLVVVLIIGVLAAIALPQYQTAVERSRATEALTQMSAVSDALQRYHSQYEAFPSADAFNKLDVDIPTYTDTTGTHYGGKHFTLSFTNAGVITSTRRLEKGAYVLKTTISENSNGTYSTTRTCTAKTGDADTTTANEYCNAIAGSSTNASNGF